MMTALESFQAVANRYCLDPEDEPEATTVSMEACLRTGADPRDIIRYLANLGVQVKRPADLLQINQLADEEELSAFRCLEGVAVSHASDGWFVLFTE